MNGVPEWLSYECAWTRRHHSCHDEDCECFCHAHAQFDDEEDFWYRMTAPDDEA
jgi:hypothetical protein